MGPGVSAVYGVKPNTEFPTAKLSFSCPSIHTPLACPTSQISIFPPVLLRTAPGRDTRCICNERLRG